MRGEETPAADDASLLASLELLAQTDLRRLLDAVHQPVLLIHGAADPLMPLAAAERLLLALPDARLDVFGGCAHAPFASEPTRFVDTVRRFAGVMA
jgi:pimeloyl-[acyl-carrier protein] methyl ester esterase